MASLYKSLAIQTFPWHNIIIHWHTVWLLCEEISFITHKAKVPFQYNDATLTVKEFP